LIRSRLIFGAALGVAIVGGPILATHARAADEIVVRSGDTLTSISQRHGVPIDTLVELNRIANPSRIYAGQRLRLVEAAAPAGAKPAAPAPAQAANRAHTVRSGEHLTGIARHYGVSIAEIVAANGISNASRIYAGQRLVIPSIAPAASAASAAKPMPESMASLVARRDAVRRVIVEEAQRFDVPVAFALAVAWQESGWQQGVVSSANAIGVMQLLPSTADWVGEAQLGTTIDPRDLRQNVRAGVRLLAHYLDRYDGDRARVLAAYYQGQSAVDRSGIYAVSRPYIASIAALEAVFGD
jgi:soluble lytic murein transglycosylase-like protein